MPSIYPTNDLYRALPWPAPLALPCPRVEVLRYMGKTGGFATKHVQLWSIKAIGFGEVVVSSVEDLPSHESMRQCLEKLAAATDWPVVQLKKVVQTEVIFELETLIPQTDDDEDDNPQGGQQ